MVMYWHDLNMTLFLRIRIVVLAYIAESKGIKVSKRCRGSGKSVAWLGLIGNPSVDRGNDRGGRDLGGIDIGNLFGHAKGRAGRARSRRSKGSGGTDSGSKEGKRKLHGRNCFVGWWLICCEIKIMRLF